MIGPRSTRIRALDGMQITVPNADLARMQVTNKTCRDSTLFRHTLGFTYAASPAALAEFSGRMLEEIGHCPLDGAAELPPWVRVVALRPASIDVEVRADLVARDENDFSRQQEQLLLAAMAHAEALGLTFADPHAVNVTLPRPAAACMKSDPSLRHPPPSRFSRFRPLAKSARGCPPRGGRASASTRAPAHRYQRPARPVPHRPPR